MENQLLVNRSQFCLSPCTVVSQEQHFQEYSLLEGFFTESLKPALPVSVNILLALWNAAAGYNRCNTYVRARNSKQNSSKAQAVV